MITSIHTLIYSDDAKATRAFLRDVLGWKYVTEEFDDDWLIFKSGVSKMSVHPTHSEWEGQTYDQPRHHDRAHVRGYGGESGRLLFSAQLCTM